MLAAALVVGVAVPAHATVSGPPFTQCPAVGADTSCGILIEVTDSGTTVLSDPTQGPYDGNEDTLVGVVNESSHPIDALALRSSTNLFGFEGDGICSYGAGCYGPTGYEGPNTSFSDVSPDSSSGVVNFPAGLASGASTYFSLEESLSSANVQTGTGQGVVGVHEQGMAPNQWENTTTCSTSKPVNCASGEFWHTFTDVSIPGRGVPLGLSRTYNSTDAATDGPFGHGWTSSYMMSLAVDTAGNATVTQGGGASVTFSPGSYGAFTAPSRVFASLARNSDGSYTLTDTRTQVRYTFTATGQLTTEVDRNGNTTTLAYTGGQLASVTDPAGRALTFTTDANNHITKVSDPAGRTVTYTYDTSDNLTSVTDVAGGTTNFGYDGSHLLTSMTDPRGATTTNVYDGQGRVVTQTDPLGRVTSFAYSGDPATVTGSSTTITDPRGVVTEHTYSQLQLLSVTRAAGMAAAASWAYSYDPFTLGIAAVTDPNGARTRYTYDRNGNVLTVTDPLNRVTTIAYNYLNEPTQVTQPSGASASYSYDYVGNLTGISAPLSGTSGTTDRSAQLTYGDSAHPGDVTAVTDPNGATSTFGYDANGNLASSTDPLGNAGRFTYDSVGRRLTATSPMGNVTTLAYDPFGDVVKTIDALGRISTATYDANRNVTAAADATGNTTHSVYDAGNELTAVTRADGTTLSYVYDADGNQVSQTDAAHQATGYTFDPLNRVGAATDPLGRVTTYGYDPAGNTTSVTDPRGITTGLAYDAARELSGLRYSDATPPVAYTYTADGQRAGMTDGTGTSSDTYDTLHRLVSSTDGNGATVTYGYDLNGHVTSLGYPNGKTVTRKYDSAGRLIGVTDWNGKTTTITPDADGNTATETYGNGVVAAATFDATGRVTNISDSGPAGALASFAYTRDANGRLTSETSTGVGQSAQTYAYTPLNQLASVNTAALSYDPTGNVTQLPTGGALTYDAASAVTSAAGTNGLTTTFSYDQAGDRTSSTGANVATGAAACGLCILAAGNGTLTDSGTAAVTSSGVITVNSPSPTAIVASGAATVTGTAIYTPGAGKTTGRAAVSPTPVAGSATDPFAGTPAPSVTGTPGAVSISTGSKTLQPGIYASIKASGNATLTLAPGTYVLTGDMNVSGSATLTATGATAYLACANYPTPCATGTKGAAVHLSGNGAVTLNGAGDPSGITVFADPQNTAGIAIDGSATASITGHVYASAGQLTATGAAKLDVAGTIAVATVRLTGSAALTNTAPPHTSTVTYAYDAAHRLTKVTGATTSAYTYNGDGLRTSATTGGATQQYAWDLANALPLLLTDGSTSYLYDDSGAPIEQIAADGTTLYYQHDQYGSTRLLTNAAGAVAATFSYTANGQLTTHTGTADTPLRWNGQYQDSTGLYYLHARYYDPATAQFMTRDPLVALTQEAYGYVGNNVFNASDPSGLICWSTNCLANDAVGAGKEVAHLADDAVTDPFYLMYWGSLDANGAIHWTLGQAFGQDGCHIADVVGSPLVPFEAVGLGGDVAGDWFKEHVLHVPGYTVGDEGHPDAYLLGSQLGPLARHIGINWRHNFPGVHSDGSVDWWW